MSTRSAVAALHLIAVCVFLVAVESASGDSAGQPAPTVTEQVRGGHLGSAASDGGVLPKMRRAGMNSIFVPIKEQTPEERAATLNRWQRLTADHGIYLFPLVNIYRPSDRSAFPLQRRYTDLGGRAYQTPCPNDLEFWRRKITDVFIEIARWAKDQPNVPGILLEAEMYGADQTVYPDACFCDVCRREVGAELQVDPESLDLSKSADLAKYRKASVELVRQHTIETRQRTREVFPQCILGGYVLDHDSPFYHGLLLAWGTPEQPVLVGGERTHTPNHARSFELKKTRLADWGAHAEMLPGLFGISRVPAENIAEQLYFLARGERGYFLYDLIALGDSANPSHVLPGDGPPAYWTAIAQANHELDRWLASGGTHQSTLQIRPFALPAPGIAMSAWKKLDLPPHSGPGPKAEFMRRHGQGLFYFVVAAGDDVRLPVHIDPINSREPDAVGLVVIDPDRKVVFEAKATAAGTEVVQFRAENAGTYCLIAKSIRYAFQLGASSHGWIADAPLAASIALYKPHEMFVQPRRGADRILLEASVPGAGEAVVVTVRTLDGSILFQRTVDGPERREIAVPLAPGDVRPLHITFIEAPGGTVEDVTFSLLEGAMPFIAASAAAPFPTE